MENASKALIMAGGVLLAMLIITLFAYAWSLFSKYQTSKDSLADIENTSKFNDQFTQFDRKDVLGYEILSLVNKVVDYNERKTTDSKVGNDLNSKCITLTITMSNVEKLTYDNTSRLFKNQVYKDDEFSAKNRNNSKSSFEASIITEMNNALQNSGIPNDDTVANKVAKSIGSIFLTEDEIENKAKEKKYGSKDAVYQAMVNIYNSVTGLNENIDFAKNNLVVKKNANSNKYYVYACEFYEYMQFKRAIFECTNVSYDNESGRVEKIDFKFTGKIK